MNVIERMMMMQLAEAVQHNSDPIDAASVLASQEAKEIAGKVDPNKTHGMIVIAVEDAGLNANGEAGVSLSCAMAGSPAVLDALTHTVHTMLRAAALQEQMKDHPLGAILGGIMGDSVMTSEKAHDRFSSEGKTQQ